MRYTVFTKLIVLPTPERSLIIMNDLPADADCEERIEVDGGNLMRRNVWQRKGSVAQGMAV